MQSRPSRLCPSHSPGLAQPCSALLFVISSGGSFQLVLPPGTKQGTGGAGTARATARYCQGKQCKVSNVKRYKEYQECIKKHVEQDMTAALVKESALRDLVFCNLPGVSVESPAFWSCIVQDRRQDGSLSNPEARRWFESGLECFEHKHSHLFAVIRI